MLDSVPGGPSGLRTGSIQIQNVANHPLGQVGCINLDRVSTLRHGPADHRWQGAKEALGEIELLKDYKKYSDIFFPEVDGFDDEGALAVSKFSSFALQDRFPSKGLISELPVQANEENLKPRSSSKFFSLEPKPIECIDFPS